MERVLVLTVILFWVFAIINVASTRCPGGIYPVTMAPAIVCPKPTGNFTNACAHVVDYDYINKYGDDGSLIIADVNALLNQDVLLFIPKACRDAMVDLVCALNYPMFDPVGALTGFPRRKVCSSRCNAVLTSCGPIKSLMSGDVQALLTDCSNPTFFASDNGSCALPGFTPIYNSANSAEAYNGEYCAGVRSDILPMSGSIINSNYSAVQEEYVYQNFVNAKLSELNAQLPPFLSTECYGALRAFMCAKSFFKPRQVTIGEILEDNNIPYNGNPQAAMLAPTELTLPANADMSVCREYENKCATFYIQFEEGSDASNAFKPSCDAVTTVGNQSIKLFSEGPEKLTSITIAALARELNVYMKPLSLDNDTSAMQPYQTTCPARFVVPEDPTSAYVTYVPGTGCAGGCLAPFYTEKDFDTFFEAGLTIGIMGMVLSVATFMILKYDIIIPFFQSYEIMIPLAIYLAMSFVMCAFLVVLNSGLNDDEFCENNVVRYGQYNTPNTCVVAAGVTVYAILASSFIFLFVSLNIYNKCHKHLNMDPKKLLYVEIALIFILPLVPLIVSLEKKWLGFSGSISMCTFMGQGNPIDNSMTRYDSTYALGAIVLVVSILSLLINAATIIRLRMRVYTKIVPIESGLESAVEDFDKEDFDKEETVLEDVPSNNSSPVHHHQPAKSAQSQYEVEAQDKDDKELSAFNHLPKSNKPDDSLTSNLKPSMVMEDNLDVQVIIGTLLGSVMVILVWGSLGVIRINTVFLEYDKMIDSAREWVTCAFTNFDGTEASWVDACGLRPNNIPKLPARIFYILVMNGNVIFFFVFIVILKVFQYLFPAIFGGSAKSLSTATPTSATTRVVMSSSRSSASASASGVPVPAYELSGRYNLAPEQ